MPTATPTTPASETRELALTRETPGGSRRGTVAERVRTYALEATSTPNAAGYSSMPPPATASAMTQARKPRSAKEPAIAPRRPCRKRSRTGPMMGAITTKGAIVTSR